MLESVINILLSNDYHNDIIPILLVNKSIYKNHYLWNKIINKTYYKNKTLLMMYAINNNLERCQFLLDAGINPNIVDSENRTAMIYALAGDADSSPHKCKSCNLKIIEEICKKDINLNIIDDTLENPIFYAIRLGYIDAIKILCKYNFNINYKNKDGITAINLAIKLNKFDICCELLKAGADINSTDNDKHNILMVALNNNVSYDIIEELLKKNINVNHIDYNMCTPLMYAIVLKPIEIIKLLLSYGADINMSNIKNQSSLMYAVVKNNIEIINTLCNYNITSDNYYNSIKYAIQLKNYDMGNLLKKKLKKIK